MVNLASMKNLNKSLSLTIILFFYLVAFFIIYLFFNYLPGENKFFQILYADLIGTAVIFIFSRLMNNSSVYDPYWSVAPPVIALYLVSIHPEGNRFRQMIILILVFFWGIRLTWNWARGWHGIKHQDWRYSDLQKQTGKMYWPVSFIGIHLMPTLLVYLGCLPLFYALSNPFPIGFTEWIAIFITLSAIGIEWIADEQLRAFRLKNPVHAVMRTGLWKLMRHPNYFGEISFWFGIYIFVFTENMDHTLWTAIGIFSIILLFSMISVPMMDKHNLEKRPEYADHMKEVPALIPFIKKNEPSGPAS